MTVKQLLTLRLQNQQLTQQKIEDPAELVAWMGVVQAQDYAMSKWAVGQRLQKATDGLVEVAINSGALLRTHVLRPTWHLVHCNDIRWMLKLTAPQILKQMSYYDRQLGITPKEVSRALSLFAKSLAGQQLTRPELQAIFTKAKFNCESMRFGHLLMYAEMNALICSGTRKGKHNSYALLDEVVAPLPLSDKNDSLLLLAQKYFQSHGPATIKDFIWWSGLSAADGNEAVRLLGDTIVSDTVDGQVHLFFDTAIKSARKKAILLLPNYDEYTVAYADRSALLSAEETKISRGNPLFNNAVVIDGTVAGTWKRIIKNKQVVMDVDMFKPVTDSQVKMLEQAKARYQAFLAE